ncbi:MmgE/PrpD family protein [Xanthobacter tagetidis]|uniref:MmgE/PrpD family protein n=2 Tax=Xanthobacter tagetidis TaxID=60216 RepID=A0A3L7A3W2_9HYPH|nr:MmgE/PrpD family protein [Xanthobacter tagetidis]
MPSMTSAAASAVAEPAPSHVRDGLAAIATEIRFEDLPHKVVAKAKMLILDTVGCALGGLSGAPTRAVHAMVEALGGRPEATIIGAQARTSCALATFANGTALRYLDVNDYYFGRDPAHASGNLAAILAVGEKSGASGRDIIAALVAAYEVQFRLCDHAGTPSLWDRGWHHATNMSYASAAAAARLMGLDAARTAEALAIAGTHGNILTESMRGRMATIKATIEAVAAKGGVEAALMAAHGLTGPETIFEGAYGWDRAVAGGSDLPALAAPLDGTFRIMQARIKPFEAFSPAQGLVQAALDLRARLSPQPEDIVAIEGRFPQQILDWPTSDGQKAAPTTKELADHSPYYLMAVALMDGACGPAQFTPERLADPVLRTLLAKATLVADAAFTRDYHLGTGAAVTVTLRDGSKAEAVCPLPPGHPDNPLDDAAMARKFNEHADPAVGAERARAIRDAIAGLDRARDIRHLMGLLAAPAANAG